MNTNRIAILIAAVLILVGCSRNTSPAVAAGDDRSAIEAALTKYLNERGTIKLDAMDMKIEDLKIAGDRADAQVMFRTKQGQGEMRMAYVLARQNGEWVVQPSPRSPAGAPHEGVAMPQGDTALPSGHPSVAAPEAQTPPAKKP